MPTEPTDSTFPFTDPKRARRRGTCAILVMALAMVAAVAFLRESPVHRLARAEAHVAARLAGRAELAEEAAGEIRALLSQSLWDAYPAFLVWLVADPATPAALALPPDCAPEVAVVLALTRRGEFKAALAALAALAATPVPGRCAITVHLQRFLASAAGP